MNAFRALFVGVMLAASPLAAQAQADNSNAVMTPDRIVVASNARNDAPAWTRWLRDEPRRRETMHAGREGLTAAELGLLVNRDFAFGTGSEGPVPVPTP